MVAYKCVLCALAGWLHTGVAIYKQSSCVKADW